MSVCAVSLRLARGGQALLRYETTTMAMATTCALRQRSSLATAVDEASKVSQSILPGAKDASGLFHDFKYRLTPAAKSEQQIVDERFVGAITREEDRPLVFLFGWAGASEKNLNKYSEIYQRAGCSTMAYILPTRFIFRSTADVPYITEKLLKVVELEGLAGRPIFVHNLSDTGLMCYQGLHKVLAERQLDLNIRGTIMDSCPGPRPNISLSRVAALMLVNWTCCLRDGMSMAAAAQDTIKLLQTRAWPNYLRKLKGLPLVLSEIDSTWSGNYLKAEKHQPWSELFLYSKTDFYLPYRYLEETVLKPHREAGRDVHTHCWDKSGHVAHLRAHKKSYEKAVLDFVFETHFKRLQEKRAAE